MTADANKVASLEGLGHWSADPANKQGRRSLAADTDKGTSIEGGLVTGQQMQLISRDREAWQQLQIGCINS